MANTFPDRLGAALLVSKLTDDGADFAFYLALVNQTAAAWVVNFPSSQQFDFALADSTGNEYWRWSTGQVFTPTQTSITVKGGPSGGFYVAGPVTLTKLPRPATASAYVKLTAALTSSNFPFTASCNIMTPQ